MGKRPDQYQIDPSEGGATDYKNLPQTGRGHSAEVDTVAIDKQQLAQGKKEAKGQPAPPNVPHPSVHTRRGKKLSPEEIAGEGGDEAAGKGDEKA